MERGTQVRMAGALAIGLWTATASGADRAGADAPGVRAAPSAAPGIASVYADRLDGRLTASGETYDRNALTAAHRFLPFGSRVRVTNVENHRSVVVRINDRGPHVRNRVIDLTPRAAAAIGLAAHSVGRVRLEVLRTPAPAGHRNGAAGGKSK